MERLIKMGFGEKRRQLCQAGRKEEKMNS
jgi:hypothetical protein